MNSVHLSLLLKVFILSIVISLAIKYLAPSLSLEPSPPLVLGLLLAPTGVMAALFWFKLRSSDSSPS
ncbi:MAG: hypothetical protein VKL98_06185 [Cyanobacteriota bacterium]|nr:hypothetical protein [Cyanobacteriota bacterium]